VIKPEQTICSWVKSIGAWRIDAQAIALEETAQAEPDMFRYADVVARFSILSFTYELIK
jgi:hypothetical protein